MAKTRIQIEDLKRDAAQDLTQDDIQKVTGGATLGLAGSLTKQVFLKVTFNDLVLSSYQTGGSGD